MDNDITCIIWTGEKATFSCKDYEEMSMWVIQVLIGRVNCIFLTASPPVWAHALPNQIFPLG